MQPHAGAMLMPASSNLFGRRYPEHPLTTIAGSVRTLRVGIAGFTLTLASLSSDF